MTWCGETPEATLRELHSFGLNAAQLGIPGTLPLQGQSKLWQEALAPGNLAIVTAVCSYTGESYADISAVSATVGLVPPLTRQERVARTKAVSDFAGELTIPGIACHIGFIPHDSGVALYTEMTDLMRDLCDHCGERGQTFALETGQEPAQVLLQFINDVRRPNLRINFDPANLILYGTGSPLEALDLIAELVVSVHCKDGWPPPAAQLLTLGEECRLGDGAVNIPSFIERLRALGYRGILSIEREESDPVRRAADIRHAVHLLHQLTTVPAN